MHAEDKLRTRKRIVWTDKLVKRQQEVLKPFTKIVKRLNLEQQTVERPQVKMVKKVHKVKKTVYKQEARNVTNIVW